MLVSLAKKFHVTRASWIIRIDHYDKWKRLVTSELSIPSDRRVHEREQSVSYGKLALSKFRPHLHTISTHVSIYHFRQSRISSTGERLRDASHSAGNGTVSAVDGSSITFPIENTKFGSLPAFSSVCFKQLPSATFFKRSRFQPTQPTEQSTPTLESNRAIISFLSEILKTRNQPKRNQCEVISVI